MATREERNRGALEQLENSNKFFQAMGHRDQIQPLIWTPCRSCGEETPSFPGRCDACQEAERIAKEKEEVRRDIRDKLSSLCIPKRWDWAKNIGSINEHKDRVRLPIQNVDAYAKFINEPRIIFEGTSGTGKTSFACAMLRTYVIENRKRARFVFCPDLPVLGLTRRNGSTSDIIDNAKDMPLVLLDELGSEDNPAWNPMPEIVYARYNDDLPIWVTTGKDDAFLKNRYGDQIFGRLFENAKRIRLGK